MKKLYIVLTMMFIIVTANLSAQKEVGGEATLHFDKITHAIYNEKNAKYETQLTLTKNTVMIFNYRGKNGIRVATDQEDALFFSDIRITEKEPDLTTYSGIFLGEDVVIQMTTDTKAFSVSINDDIFLYSNTK